MAEEEQPAVQAEEDEASQGLAPERKAGVENMAGVAAG
jgi:hypothetical protein